MKLPATLIAALCLTASLSAQTAAFTDPANLRGERVAPRDGRELPVDQGALGLQQLLRKLSTRASLMLIVAHPDDEDSGMLTLYSRGLGARAAILTLNRGEGGQNAMTGDFEDALGLLRTQELLSADRYSGVTQMFGTEVDFGFSKTKEEAFAKWTHERVLYDAVRAVRLYRPLVIASVFVGGVTDGHGHHQVSGEIAQEVFKAAGDPKVFPELTTEGILPWQPLKVYARVPMQRITPQGLFDSATGQYTPARFTNYVTGEVTSTQPSADVVVHEGSIDPLLGPYPAKEPFVSYVQFARQGLGLQQSQIGPGMRVPGPGVFDVSYHRYGSQLPSGRQMLKEVSFFDGIDISLEGIADLAPNGPLPLRTSLAKIASQIHLATEQLNPENLLASAPYLATALDEIDALITSIDNAAIDNAEQKADVLHELRIKRVQLNDALVLALGLTMDATAHGANQIAGSAIQVLAQVRTASSQHLAVSSVHLATAVGQVAAKGSDHAEAPDLTADHSDTRTLTATPAFTLVVTRPYFYRDSIEDPVYQLKVPALRNAPQTPPAMVAWARIDYRGTAIELGRVVHDEAQAVQIVPAASLSLSQHAQVLPNDASALTLGTMLSPVEKPAKEPKLAVPAGWKIRPAMSDTTGPGEMGFTVEAQSSHRVAITIKASVVLPNHETVSEGYRSIGYGNLQRTHYYTPATDRIAPVDLKLPAKTRIGYLPGTGDDVPAALTSVGLKPDTLTVADLTPAKLANYDTVILGVRTYNAHPELHGAATQALFDYAKEGGNVVVQYQTAEFTGEDAPYPLTLGRDAEKVVDETDPVQLLDAKAPLLSTPNAITPADFNGWVEERGHGFLRTWDAHYTVLTEVHDPGEEPQRGGLVTVSLGKGRWTYVAFALYRQLPEAVPGAYRLFVNLLNP